MSDFKQMLRTQYEAYLREDITRRNGHQGTRVKLPSVYERLESPSQSLQITNYNRVWVSSDLHFDHKNIIQFSDRPFTETEAMNQALIEQHNSRVKPDDTWICVGDVGFKGVQRISELVEQMNGYKILVVGNHDIKKKKFPDYGFDEVHLLYYLDHPGAGLVFTHFPWNLRSPLINVHGHLHKYHNIETDQHINVCCEFHNYKPIPLDLIAHWASGMVNKLGHLRQTCLVCDNRHALLRPTDDTEAQCPFCGALYNQEDLNNE